MKNPFSKATSTSWKPQAGVSALEYALLAALIALGIIAAARAIDARHTPASEPVGATLNASPRSSGVAQ